MENLIKKTCLSQFTLIYFLLILSSDMLQENFLYFIIPKYCIAFFYYSLLRKTKIRSFPKKTLSIKFFFCIFYHAIFLTRPRTVFPFSILNYRSTQKALAEWNINCNSMYVDTFDRKIKVGS